MRRSEFHDYVMHDLLSRIGGRTSRAMFGGWGLYKDGVVFGIIADGQLYFKVDETSRKDYQALGSRPFTYEGAKRKLVTISSYWEVPPDVMEDAERLAEWVDRSCEASQNDKKHSKQK